MAERRSSQWSVHRNGNQLYIADNVVRKPEFVADPAIEYDHRKQVEISRQRRRNQDFARQMNRKYIGFLMGCTAIVFAAIAMYLGQINSTSALKDSIQTLESQVADMKATNDEMESNMNSSINVEEIRNIAISELGMVYAAADQVVLYDYEESQYVRQYEAIPEAE